MKSTIYKWHRKLGLFILIPLFIWTISGILHPIMGWLKPNVPNKFLKSVPINPTAIGKSLQEVLSLNSIESITDFKLITIGENQYYQVFMEGEISYINADTGLLLQDGDKVYAKSLARYFSNDQNSIIKNIEVISDFTMAYREINRLLPVYKVDLDRGDGLTLYIHTPSSRLGTANNTTRKRMLYTFNFLHNWEFIWFNKNVRLVIILLFSSLTFMTAIAGLILYLSRWRNFKKIKARNTNLLLRKYHRSIGVSVSIFMLLFAFSGFYHGLIKLGKTTGVAPQVAQSFYTNDLNFSLNEFLGSYKSPIKNVGLISINKKPYLQVFSSRQEAVYINLKTAELLKNGEQKHAEFLASKFSGMANHINAKRITKFAGEYGFVNKRLPVWRVDYNTNKNLTYYVETTTRKLALKVEDADRSEGFSFAFLHKYHYLDFLGKNARNGIMIFITLCIALLALLGIRIYIK